MQIQHFLPYYPPINKDLQKNIVFQKEFYDAVYDDDDTLRSHQRIIARFLSNYTIYNQILLYHQMGTGKTCASIAAIEEIQNNPSNSYKRAIILTPSSTLKIQYRTQVMLTCMPHKPKNLNFYQYDTFCTFQGITDRNPKAYDNTIFVIDEVHKLKDTPHAHRINLDSPDTFGIGESPDKPFLFTNKDTIYIQSTKPFSYKDKQAKQTSVEAPYRLSITLDKIGSLTLQFSLKNIYVFVKRSPYSNVLHTLRQAKHTKLILMSGTPMTDSADEFLSIINLLNPQNPVDKLQFTKDNFNETVKKALYGKISYLRAKENVDIEYKTSGSVLPQMSIDRKTFLPLYYLNMGEAQNETYSTAETVQCAKADIKCGVGGFNNQIQLSKISVANTKSPLTKENVASNSAKFNEILQSIQNSESPNNRHFIYCEFVKDGVEKLSKLLSAYKLQVTIIKSIGKDADTPIGIAKKIDAFNKDTNFKKPKILISSRMISEGITLENITHIHIVTPHWNMAVIDQAIARGIRYKSHELLQSLQPGRKPTVNIYLYAAIPKDTDRDAALQRSIDYRKYKRSFEKDVDIKRVEKLLRDIAFDCNLHTFNNTPNSKQHHSRDCYYEDCTPPQCLSPVDITTIDKTSLVKSSYNLYYSKFDMFYSQLISILSDPPTRFITAPFTLDDINTSFTTPPSLFTLNNVVNHILYNRIVLFSKTNASGNTYDYGLASNGNGLYYIHPLFLPNPTPIHMLLSNDLATITPNVTSIPIPTPSKESTKTIPSVQPRIIQTLETMKAEAKANNTIYGVFIAAKPSDTIPTKGEFTINPYISINDNNYSITPKILDLQIPMSSDEPGEDESKGEQPTQLYRGNLYIAVGKNIIGKKSSSITGSQLKQFAISLNIILPPKIKNHQLSQLIMQKLQNTQHLILITV